MSRERELTEAGCAEGTAVTGEVRNASPPGVSLSVQPGRAWMVAPDRARVSTRCFRQRRCAGNAGRSMSGRGDPISV